MEHAPPPRCRTRSDVGFRCAPTCSSTTVENQRMYSNSSWSGRSGTMCEDGTPFTRSNHAPGT